MKITILLYDRLAALDAIGPYEVMRCVPGWEVELVGARAGEVRAEGGLGLIADRAIDTVTETDVVLVPGGEGCEAVASNPDVLEWLRAVDRSTKWTISVCTGAAILGAAGLLRGKRATTNWLFLDRLHEFGAEPVESRFVVDGRTITAAGVTAGLDMALDLLAREGGPELAQAVQLGLEYDPAPPFDSGSPAKAPAAIVDVVRAASRAG